MSIEIKIPAVGESITEVTLATWMKSDGDYVEMDEEVCEIESDKASMELPAPAEGVLKITAQEGDTVEVGAVIGTITPGDKPKGGDKAPDIPVETTSSTQEAVSSKSVGHASPAASKILREKGVDASSVNGTGKDGRVTKADAMNAKKQAPKKEASSSPQVLSGERNIERKKMSPLRKTIARRLVEAKNTTAMLTTFNEVDMHEIMALRKKYKEMFKEKHEIGLGFMSFFTKAVCMAMTDFPGVNAQIDGTEMLYHNYVDVGIAVSTPKGLVVPVVRDAQSLSLAGIEKAIMGVALKARDGKLKLEEMQGGTFTITNGGVFGSMLSTPIINLPQSAILGMHNIVQRPMAVNGEVKIRPIMYIALSYDHRVIDGRESVGFLKRVKDLLEDPSRLLLDI